MMWGQPRASRGVMGVDTRMIAGVRGCLIFAPDRSSPTIQPTPHYAEALPSEWVWKNVKHDWVGRAGASGPKDLKAKALAALHRLLKLPHLVRSVFRDPNLRYITA
jgi:hypothetical protein